eukprot:gene37454-45483_t
MINSESMLSLADSLSWVADLSREGDVEEVASNSSSDATSGDEKSSAEYTPGCFEGPEKTMEVVFRGCDEGSDGGLRSLSRAQLDLLCKKARCTILHRISNEHLDAYILSESSLFVYPHKILMKTCGTTTLLRCLSYLLDMAQGLGLTLAYVGYSRKNLSFPQAQQWPHGSFPEELTYLASHPKLQRRLQGTGHVLGPVTGDHWYVYVADHSKLCPAPLPPLHAASALKQERTVNIMMFDMHPEVAPIFFLHNTPVAKEMTRKAGIDALCEDAVIDETAFTPCGYSMNSICEASYSTIHVTPEESCSYASFETNRPLQDYLPLLRAVLAVFRPARFVLTLMGDEGALDSLSRLPTQEKTVRVQKGEAGSGGFVSSYVRTAGCSASVDADLGCAMACYSLAE